MAQAGSCDDGDLGAKGRDGAGIAGVGAENVIDNVQDAVHEENVLLQDARRVDEERIGREGEGELTALLRLQRGPVKEAITVADPMGTANDVVVE